MRILASLILGLWVVAGSGWLLTRGDGKGLDAAAVSLGTYLGSRSGPAAGESGADQGIR